MHNVLSLKKQPSWQGPGNFPLNLLEEHIASHRDKTSMKHHRVTKLTSPSLALCALHSCLGPGDTWTSAAPSELSTRSALGGNQPLNEGPNHPGKSSGLSSTSKQAERAEKAHSPRGGMVEGGRGDLFPFELFADLSTARTKPRSSVGTPVPVVPEVSPCALAAIPCVSPILLLTEGSMMTVKTRAGVLLARACGLYGVPSPAEAAW